MIELICGSMKSGKTLELFKQINNAKYRNLKVVLIRPKRDTRDFVMRDNLIINQLNIKSNYDELKTGRLLELPVLDLIKQYDIFCIDEGQFFTDLAYFCFQMSSAKKEIYISALNGDSDLHQFKSISDIIPLCDKITKLSAVCEDCKDISKATFTYYDGEKKSQIKIDNDEKYLSLCFDCYLKRRKNFKNIF